MPRFAIFDKTVTLYATTYNMNSNFIVFQLIFIIKLMVQCIVNGMIGSSVIALSPVEEGKEQISEQKMLQLNMGVMHVTEQTLLRKAVTFRNAQVIDFIIH